MRLKYFLTNKLFCKKLLSYVVSFFLFKQNMPQSVCITSQNGRSQLELNGKNNFSHS